MEALSSSVLFSHGIMNNGRNEDADFFFDLFFKQAEEETTSA